MHKLACAIWEKKNKILCLSPSIRLDDDPGKIISDFLALENVRYGGNGIVPGEFQAHPQFLDNSLSDFDHVKSTLSNKNLKGVVSQDLNECVAYFETNFVLTVELRTELMHIRSVNTHESLLNMKSIVESDFLVRLLHAICKETFVEITTGEQMLSFVPPALDSHWAYPWLPNEELDWCQAIFHKYGSVSELDRKLQANLLETITCQFAKKYALRDTDFIKGMRRRMLKD